MPTLCQSKKSASHREQEDELKEEEGVPRISFDYMWQKSEEGQMEKIDSLHILVSYESDVKWVSANMAPEKGVEGYAVQAIGREIDLAGLRRMIIKSDQEPAIVDLLRVVKSERPESIELQPEESPVGESASNSEVERAIQTVQGQIRALRSSMEHRYKCTIKEDHCIWPWLIMYAGILINICLGRRRWKDGV